MADMTLEEALAAATVDEELVSPVNEVLMINPETRTINVPDSEKLFGARQDMGVERKHFKCPRIVGDNIDLSQHRIFVNYVSSKQDGTYNPKDDVQGYLCKDLAVEGDFITFSWEISENVTRSAGYIAFAVYAKTIDEHENLKTKWHTTIAIGNVLDTLPDGEEWVTVYPDVVMQLLKRMDEVEKIATPETLLDRTLKDSTKAAPADIVGKVLEDIADLKKEVESTDGAERTVILEEQTVEGFGHQSSLGVYFRALNPSPCVLELGKEYTVEWDGTEYTGTSFVFNNGESNMVAIGNTILIDGENTGVPFAVAYNSETDYLNMFSITTENSHTLAIYQDINNKLPEVTADDNGKFLRVVNGKWNAVTVTNGNEVAY